MRTSVFLSGVMALALAGCASSGTETPAEDSAILASEIVEANTGPDDGPGFGPDAEPPFFWGKTGDDGYIYHQVWGDCAMLDHGIGRNYAWGRVRMPLEAVSHAITEEGLHVTCKDGSACMEAGKLEDTPGRIAENDIPFQTKELAEAYLAQVEKLRADCKASAPRG